MPKPNPGESEADFVARYMSSEEAKKAFPDAKQRSAVAYSEYKKHKMKKEVEVNSLISKSWEENIEVEKSGIIEKDNQRFIEIPISGIKEDRDGEMMSKEAIAGMIEQLKSGTIPYFGDHGTDANGNKHAYSWKGIMGVFVDGREDGTTLRAVVRLNKAHPDHELFWKYLVEKMPVGSSIGARAEGNPTFVEVEE